VTRKGIAINRQLTVAKTQRGIPVDRVMNSTLSLDQEPFQGRRSNPPAHTLLHE